MGTFRDWLGGLISAIAGALSSSTGAAMADPNDFNWSTEEGRSKMLIVCVMAAWPAILAYLTRRPLPGVVESTETRRVTEIPGSLPIVQTTTTEKSTRPADPPATDPTPKP